MFAYFRQKQFQDKNLNYQMLKHKLQPQPDSTKHGSQQLVARPFAIASAPRLVQVNIRRQSNFYKSSAMSITRLGGGTLLTLASRVSHSSAVRAAAAFSGLGGACLGRANLCISSTITTQMNLVLLLILNRLGRQGMSEIFCNFARVCSF